MEQGHVGDANVRRQTERLKCESSIVLKTCPSSIKRSRASLQVVADTFANNRNLADKYTHLIECASPPTALAIAATCTPSSLGG